MSREGVNLGDLDGFCCSCRVMQPMPAAKLVRTRGNHWQAVARCPECGGAVVRFVSLTKTEAPAGAVKLGARAKAELERAAILTDSTQRAIVEGLLDVYLPDHVRELLDKLAADGRVSAAEAGRRGRELTAPIAEWEPPERPAARSGPLLAELLAWFKQRAR